jgi:hypothetical protein
MAAPNYTLPQFNTPLVDKNGLGTFAFLQFLRQLFQGTGSGVPQGTAATKAASDSSKANVASVSTPITLNHVAQFADTAGTIKDGGALGTAAAVATGTSGHTVPFLDGANTWGGTNTYTTGELIAPDVTTNGHLLTFPSSAADTLVGKATTDTLTHKSLDSGDGTNTVNGRQLVGTTTNDSGNAGNIGEVISSTVLVAGQVGLTTNTAANVTSISLTAGDWDVWGNVVINPAGATTVSQTVGWISTTSATLPTYPNAGALAITQPVANAGAINADPVGMTRFSLSATTTVYLEVYVSFAVSTCGAYGAIIARRRR